MDFSLTLDLTINDTLRLLPSYAWSCAPVLYLSACSFFVRSDPHGQKAPE